MNIAANGFQVFSDFKPDNPGFGVVSKKKKLMEFSVKLAGWVLEDAVFHYKKKY